MNKLTRFFFKNGEYKIALPVLGLGFTLQALLIMAYLPEFLHYSDNMKNPDQFFTYNYEYIVDLYQKLGEEGRKFYFNMLVVDFLYTTISGAGYSLLLAALAKKEKWYIILPLVLTLSDIFENISQIILMNNFPAISPSGVAISSTFSSIKMTGGAIILSLILFFIGRNIIHWVKNKKTTV
ncbi:hypothetical protein [Cytophaga hutchinsonii]|jgi:hypothetical protein|uniref:Uncharacterized protein n=1 Tax=Cytophaga hutchinsonii (strain ATCC 33406 / DSM 1761 / CIP 103989 / NBRC 15051 / NCIMB 9469 / D465) TaxID=269798 RepID=A0A6N4STG5_CYTH3|nr:hypothetical protein [Cytophaga hutchinsonii]ABG59740.1 hypothetical protein CHU_2486 [Cytophaga hutchinsonii ATCC 33406]SFX65033.1 hypothetical protein SAMN04487930_10744 [Cytophaga hutchinsonii ATCC 33406]